MKEKNDWKRKAYVPRKEKGRCCSNNAVEKKGTSVDALLFEKKKITLKEKKKLIYDEEEKKGRLSFCQTVGRRGKVRRGKKGTREESDRRYTPG